MTGTKGSLQTSRVSDYAALALYGFLAAGQRTPDCGLGQ